MKFILTLLSIIMIFSAIQCENNHVKNVEKISKNHALKDSTKDSLSFVLCKLYSADQGIRDRELFGSTEDRLIVKIDSANFAELIFFIKKFGIPSKGKLGTSNFSNTCVEGAFGAIMLHNPHRLINDKNMLNFFIKFVKNGELKAEALATILDKYYWAKSGGDRVIYGSQFGVPCIKDSAETNRLREEIGLQSLKKNEFKNCTQTK
jgi:hypothetical protein